MNPTSQRVPSIQGLSPLLLITAMTALASAATDSWTLANAALETKIAFRDGKLSMASLINPATKRDYLAGRQSQPFFTHTVAGVTCPADDGKWTLGDARVSPIELYGKSWGTKLELTLTRAQPATFSVRQVFELYDGGSLRCLSFVRNGTDKPLAMGASDVFNLNLPDEPHEIHYVTGNLMWNVGKAGVHRVGRNAIVSYQSGDGWFVVPENNWATCIEPGRAKATAREKLLYIHAWDNEPKVRVSTNPNAVQLTLFPREEVEYFSVNLGIFKGDAMDGRMAVAEHLRRRFKYHNPAHILSTNDWQWGHHQRRRTDKNYRDIVVPKAKAAGFDRIQIDDGWYAPDDSTTPAGNWTDMVSLGRHINEQGLKVGHWFSLQGRFCTRGWADGRDAADPANIDFKLRQMEDELIGKYHSSWDQVDAGLLWKTDREPPYSHPMDSVYRKILGMKRYMNTIAHKYPDFIMQTTCEVDNPGGPGEEGVGAGTHGVGNQNVGLIQLADNGIMGMFRRSEYADDVRDLFAAVGLFPLEGMLSTHGEDQVSAASWQDSPLWYYQFLLARHTMIYSWPGDWSDESVKHLRVFNDWRRNPRFQSLLGGVMRPVYNGPDPVKNEGPWCWMFTDEGKTQALVFAINHRDLNKVQSFDAKLRWLDDSKTYYIEEITQLPDASFNYNYRGEFPGAHLKTHGLPIDLDAGEERCAAFFVREKTHPEVQLLYADSTITGFTTKNIEDQLHLELTGSPNAKAQVIVAKPGQHGVEMRTVPLDATGHASVMFDARHITQSENPKGAAAAITTHIGTRDTSTGGAWRGKYGSLAAWIAGNKTGLANGFSLTTDAPVHVWHKGDASAVPRVLDVPPGTPGPKMAACWTTGEKFSMRVGTPPDRRYRLSVYLMDYDNGQRGMDITVRSADGTLHDRQSATVAEMANGIYLTWNVTGPATIKAVKNAGFNAAVSGVFVDDEQ